MRLGFSQLGYWAVFGCVLCLLSCPDTTLPLIEGGTGQGTGNTGGDYCTLDDLAPVDPNTLVAHFIDVGQGDGMWLQLPTGDPGNPLDLIVDTGDGPSYPTDDTPDAGTIMGDYLENHGMPAGTIIEWLMITHGDSDHFGGTSTLMSRFPIRGFMGSGYTATTNSWPEVRLEIQSKVEAVGGLFASPMIPSVLVSSFGARVEELSNTLVEVQVFWGYDSLPSTVDDKSNNSGLVIKVTSNGKSLLLTGDIDEDVEAGLVKMNNAGTIDLTSHVLKVPHHGSDSSSSEIFLNAVFDGVPEGERFAVIQSGRRRFGPNSVTLPREEIVDRLIAKVGEGHLLSTVHGDEEKENDESGGDDHVVLTIGGGGIRLCYNPGGLYVRGDSEDKTPEDDLDDNF